VAKLRATLSAVPLRAPRGTETPPRALATVCSLRAGEEGAAERRPTCGEVSPTVHAVPPLWAEVVGAGMGTCALEGGRPTASSEEAQLNRCSKSLRMRSVACESIFVRGNLQLFPTIKRAYPAGREILAMRDVIRVAAS
jgi:hypothetical protein